MPKSQVGTLFAGTLLILNSFRRRAGGHPPHPPDLNIIFYFLNHTRRIILKASRFNGEFFYDSYFFVVR